MAFFHSEKRVMRRNHRVQQHPLNGFGRRRLFGETLDNVFIAPAELIKNRDVPNAIKWYIG
jgi:hypothetical protein